MACEFVKVLDGGAAWGSCLKEPPEHFLYWPCSCSTLTTERAPPRPCSAPRPVPPQVGSVLPAGGTVRTSGALPLWDFLALPLKKLAFSSPALASLLHEAGHDSLCQWLFESTFSTYLGPHDSREALWNLRLLSPSKGLKEARLRMAVPWEPAQMMSEADVLCCAQTLQLCPTLCDPTDCSRLLCPQDSPGKNTGVGYHSVLWGTFPT